MNIGMVLAGRDFPPDIRVEKEIRALQAKDHHCYVICSNRDKKPFREEWEGTTIFRLTPLVSVLRKINFLFYRLFFVNIHWFRELLRIAREESLDVFHVHDLPMAGTAIKAGKALNIPVIVDFHENYPAALMYYGVVKEANHQKALGVFNRVSRWLRYEKRVARKADQVIVVVEEAKERLSKIGIGQTKITVIENTIDVDFFHNLEIDQNILNEYHGYFLISYIGGYGGWHRGLDTAVKAMPKVLEVIPQARLLLVGRGSIKPELEKLVTELNLESQVIFEDWRPFQEVPSYIQASQICLVPHQSNPHTEATSPHKLFQYMLMEKPVVVSSCKPLQRVVQETKGGLVFTAGDSDHLAKTILQLRDQTLREELGRAGKQAVLDRYNWERTSQDLIGLYEHL
jgi:glycosyltransferase involved in cell wall biosynthesis